MDTFGYVRIQKLKDIDKFLNIVMDQFSLYLVNLHTY